MRLESTLISIVALLLGFLLFFSGLLFLVPLFQSKLVAYVEGHFVQCGIALILFSVLLIGCFIPLCKRSYLLIEMGDTSIQDCVLSEMAQKSIGLFFPGKEVNCTARIRSKQRVEILANLPYVKVEEQEQLLEAIEMKLVRTLAHQCGLTGKFLLNVSFKTKSPS